MRMRSGAGGSVGWIGRWGEVDTLGWMPSWPAWWEFPLVLSVHVQKRMQERRFSETDLRAMLSDASEFRSSAVDSW